MIAGRSNTNSEQQEENSVDDSEYFQGISGCAVIYDESGNEAKEIAISTLNNEV